MSLANIGKFKLSLKALIISAFTFICFLVFSNAFWLNHTQIKYDKMNIRLKKTRYK